MPLVKVGSKHQVTIPKGIFEKLRLKPGDYLDAQLRGSKVVLTPKEIVDKEDDSWFWTKEWQAKEREADEAIAKGEVIGPFKTAKEAIRALKKTKV